MLLYSTSSFQFYPGMEEIFMKMSVMLDEKVFRDFTIFDILKRRKYWKSPVIFASIMTFSAVVCFLMHKVDGAVLLGTVLAVIGLGMPAIYFATFFRSLGRQVRLQKLDPPRNVYDIELSEKADGITVSNGKEKASYKWKDAWRAYRDRRAIYLFITYERGFILPYSSMGEEGPDAWWSFISGRMGAERSIDLAGR